jgi:hypothetical protein
MLNISKQIMNYKVIMNPFKILFSLENIKPNGNFNYDTTKINENNNEKF